MSNQGRFGRGLVVVALLAAWLLLPGTVPDAAAGDPAMQITTFKELVARAEKLANEPFIPLETQLPEVLAEQDYEAARRVFAVRDRSLWVGKGGLFRLAMHHRSGPNPQRVPVYEISDGQVTPVAFDPAMFHYPETIDPAELPGGLGFAGLRLLHTMHTPGVPDEFITFLGASYYRMVADGQVFGSSMRGLALQVAGDKPEEFPVFRAFWVDRPGPGETSVELFALLDSPSVAGAYRFAITPGSPTRVSVRQVLIPRVELDAVGLAPLTSMFWYGQADHRPASDFRPEVHDADALAIRQRDGGYVFRPLNNPALAADGVKQYTLDAPSPRGFGLLQRDRAFASYQDTEAQYDQRPSLWVEPDGDWGPGGIELTLLPTDSEYTDNVVAVWRPRQPLPAGEPAEHRYTVYATDEALPDGSGSGDTAYAVGYFIERQDHVTRLLVDFAHVAGLAERKDGMTAEAMGPDGETLKAELIPLPRTDGVRVAIDVPEALLRPEGGARSDLRVQLRRNGEVVSEQWTMPADQFSQP